MNCNDPFQSPNTDQWFKSWEIKLIKVLLVVIKLPVQFRHSLVPAAALFIAGLPDHALTDPPCWALGVAQRAH